MSEILIGSAKEEGVPSGVDMKTSVLLSEYEGDIVVLEEGEFLRRQCLQLVDSIILVFPQHLPQRRLFLPRPLHV